MRTGHHELQHHVVVQVERLVFPSAALVSSARLSRLSSVNIKHPCSSTRSATPPPRTVHCGLMSDSTNFLSQFLVTVYCEKGRQLVGALVQLVGLRRQFFGLRPVRDGFV